MKKHKIFPLIVILVFLSSCNSASKIKLPVAAMDTDFGITLTMPDSTVSVKSLLAIEEWTIDKTGLLLMSENTDDIFYHIDLDDFHAIDSFGVRGQGPDEFLFPHILRSSQNRSIIADSGLAKFFNIKDDHKDETVCPVRFAYNDINDIDFPVISFNDITRDENEEAVSIWRTINVESGEKIDSIVLYPEDLPAASFVFVKSASYGSRVVVIRSVVDEFVIADINSDGTLADAKIFKGTQTPQIDCAGFVGVACGKDCFYLLSNKNVRTVNGKEEGLSCIEIYDYNGRAVAQLKLDICAYKILFDEARNRLLLLSVNDDDIHIVNLAVITTN